MWAVVEPSGVSVQIISTANSQLTVHLAAWAPYFDDANAIIFVVSMAVFDQTLAEDPSLNRLVRSHSNL